MTWLIAYDISCPRRWRRLYRLVKDHGVRIQWSVFVVTVPHFRPATFLSAAARVIDPRSDDLRLYRLTGKVTTRPGGEALIASPGGIHWSPLRARPRAMRLHPQPGDVQHGDNAS